MATRSNPRSVHITGTRWLVYVGHDGQQQVRPVDQDAVVIAPDALARIVAEPGVEAARLLPKIIASAASRAREIERLRHSSGCSPSREDTAMNGYGYQRAMCHRVGDAVRALVHTKNSRRFRFVSGRAIPDAQSDRGGSA